MYCSCALGTHPRPDPDTCDARLKEPFQSMYRDANNHEHSCRHIAGDQANVCQDHRNTNIYVWRGHQNGSGRTTLLVEWGVRCGSSSTSKRCFGAVSTPGTLLTARRCSSSYRISKGASSIISGTFFIASRIMSCTLWSIKCSVMWPNQYIAGLVMYQSTRSLHYHATRSWHHVAIALLHRGFIRKFITLNSLYNLASMVWSLVQ
jgi:hypothetical protein